MTRNANVTYIKVTFCPHHSVSCQDLLALLAPPIRSYLDFTVQWLGPLNVYIYPLFGFTGSHFFLCCLHLTLHPPTSPLPLSFSSVIALLLWGFGVPFCCQWSAEHKVRPVAETARPLPHIPFSASLTSLALPELIKNLLDNEQLRAD